MWKDRVRSIVNYILQHGKIAFPVIVIAAVAITVSIALSVNNRGKIVNENPEFTEEPSVAETANPEADETIPMVLNEDSAMATLIATFYNAMALGDADTLNSVCAEISEQDMLRYLEKAKYIDRYPVLEVYTKPGYEVGTTIAFVYYKVVFADHEEEFPGYSAYYICTDEQGNLYINTGEISDEANEYIGRVMAQDDVVEFNNRVTVEYNELMVDHPELLEYLSEMDKQVSAAVGVALAQENSGDTQEADTNEGAQNTESDNAADGDDAEQTPAETPVENTIQYATATTTVNVRSSDSEKADKLGKVTGGTKLQVLEQKVNGWTKIAYEGKDGYIKSEFLELTESTEGMESIGTVTATTNINVRASASETADRLGVLAGGESVELLANENGWCKIKYNGKVGYVKADYVEQ